MPAHESPRPPRTIDVDVVVVGARVAGAATALLLARAGHSVALVDRVRFPSDTLSTHAIARGGVVQLARWGLLDDLLAAGTPAIREVSFHSSDGVVTRRVKETAGVDHLVAPRRHVLDPMLVAEAERAGATLHCGTTVRSVLHDRHGRVVGVAAVSDSGSEIRFRARHVVGADGLRSTVARQVSAGIVEVRPSTAATHYVYVEGLDATGFEYHVHPGSMSGVFPTNDSQACVWVCSPATAAEHVRGARADRTAEFESLLRHSAPELAERVERSSIATPVRGASRLPNQVLHPAGPGWWLVGDAGYHRDPITGHGITDALRDAELLADAIHGQLTDTLDECVARAQYVERRQRALRPVFDVTCELAEFPPPARFVELQKHLSELIEVEALALAATPPRPWAPGAPAPVHPKELSHAAG